MKNIAFLILIYFSSITAVSAENQTDKRVQLVNGRLEAARSIAEKFSNPVVKKVVNFLSESYIIFEPQKDDQTKRIVEVGNKASFGIIPIIKEDEKKSRLWNALANSGTRADSYSKVRNLPTIILKGRDEFSHLWQGLLMIHEGVHLVFRTNGALGQIPDSLMQETIDENYAYPLEMEILSFYGGEKYAALINREKEKAHKSLEKTGQIPPVNYEQNKRELDDIFGPSLSKTEQRMREDALQLHALFALWKEKKASIDSPRKMENSSDSNKLRI
jgi:hypothetical protein